jgi:hypothetical protein
VVALCLAQTAVQATSWRGVELQLIELSGAADGILSDPDVAAAIAVRGLFARQNAEKIRRLIGLIQEAVVALAPETAVDSHSDPAEAMLAA